MKKIATITLTVDLYEEDRVVKSHLSTKDAREEYAEKWCNCLDDDEHYRLKQIDEIIVEEN